MEKIIIVGLGNPGKKYSLTRHNVGFIVVDALTRALNAPECKINRNVQALISEYWFNYPSSKLQAPSSITLVKPHTFMNLSGQTVAALLRHCEGTRRPKQSPIDRHASLRFARDDKLEKFPHLIVVSDDLDLPFGTIRFRARGSAGGHKGLQSIIDALGTENFPRLRIGILPPGLARQPRKAEEFVLENFTSEELVQLKNEIVPSAVKQIMDFIRNKHQETGCKQ